MDSTYKFKDVGNAPGYFIDSCIHCYKTNPEKLADICRGLSTLPVSKILTIYCKIDETLEMNVQKENYEQAAKIKIVKDYFLENIIDKMPMPKL